MQDWAVGLIGVAVGALISVVSPLLTPLINRWERRRLRQERQLSEDWRRVFRCAYQIRDLAYLDLEPGVGVEQWTQSDECDEEFRWAHCYIGDPHPVKIANKRLNEAWKKYRVVAVEVVNLVFQMHKIPEEPLREKLDRAQADMGKVALDVIGAYNPRALRD